jgi:RNA polymerase sigma factor (sigma-70 family)
MEGAGGIGSSDRKRMTTDEELMAAYAAGDEAAFDELFRRTAPLVLRSMRRGYVREPDAQDLLQQTFLQLHRSRRDYRTGAPLRPWLMTIARNVKRDHFRRERRRDAFAPLVEDFGRDDPRFRRGDLRDVLARAVDRLPATLAAIVRARWFEERSYDEIARSLGISRGAAKVRAHRACRALRTILAPRNGAVPVPPSRNPNGPGSVDPTGP